MGNQFTKKQSRKIDVYLYIKVPISNLEMKHVLQTEKPLFQVSNIFLSVRVIVVGVGLFHGLNQTI